MLADVEVGSTLSAGDVTFEVSIFTVDLRQLDPSIDWKAPEGPLDLLDTGRTLLDGLLGSAKASINLDSATVKGGTINFDASAKEQFGWFGFHKNANAEILVTDSTIVGTSVVLNSEADTSVEPEEEVEMSDPDGTTLTFLSSDPVTDPPGKPTVTRDNGVWQDIDNQFYPSQSITISGTEKNDGSYIIESIDGDKLTLLKDPGAEDEDEDEQDADKVVEDEVITGQASVVGTAILPQLDDIAEENLLGFSNKAPVTFSNATAKTQVMGASQITATDDGGVEINATSGGSATPIGPVLAIKKFANISAAFADSKSEAIASVEGTSTIMAMMGEVAIAANTTNEVTVLTTADAQNTTVNLSVSGANTTSITRAYTGPGTIINGQSVAINADSNIEAEVAATVMNTGGSGLGAGVAISFIDVDTDAHVAGNVMTSSGEDGLVVSATATTEGNSTETDTRNLGNATKGTTQFKNNAVNFQREAAKRLNSLKSKSTKYLPLFDAEELAKDREGIDKKYPGTKSGKLNLSAAVSYVDTDQHVDAYIAETATVTTSGGDVEVTAGLTDAFVVTAVGEATSDSVALGGSLAWGDFSNDVNAYIAGNVTAATPGIDKQGSVYVDARIDVPFPWETQLNTLAELLAFDFDSALEFLHFANTANAEGCQRFLPVT